MEPTPEQQMIMARNERIAARLEQEADLIRRGVILPTPAQVEEDSAGRTPVARVSPPVPSGFVEALAVEAQLSARSMPPAPPGFIPGEQG